MKRFEKASRKKNRDVRRCQRYQRKMNVSEKSERQKCFEQNEQHKKVAVKRRDLVYFVHRQSSSVLSRKVQTEMTKYRNVRIILQISAVNWNYNRNV